MGIGMYTKRNRLIAVLLCLLLVSGICLTACRTSSEPKDGSTQTTSEHAPSNGAPSESQSPYQDASGKYTLKGVDMPEFTFPETEFRVCVYNKDIQNTYFSEEIGYDLYDTTDRVLNDAVKARNDQVLTETGVAVVAYCVPDVTVAVTEAVQTSLDVYDAAMPFMGDCTAMAQKGMLYDLKQFGNYIHLDAPWWDQSANRTLSVANKLYFTTGDISIMQKVCSNAIAFNKTLYQDACYGTYGDLYEQVRAGNWTVDLMYEMGKMATRDSDGVPGMTYQDTWGLCGSSGNVIGLYLSSGETLIGKDSQDCPVIAIGSTQRSLSYVQKLLGMLQSGNEWFLSVETLRGQVDYIWKTAVEIFGGNRALFFGCAFSGVKKLRMYPVEFGLVPMPKAEQQQEGYFTPGGGYYSYGFCIPKGVRNPEFSAYMAEMLCCYAKNTITYAYYDVTLKGRDSQDEESWEMLDQYIFHDNIVYDLGSLYDFGGVSSMVTDLAKENSDAIVSALDAKRDAINAAIAACLEAFELDS